MRASVEEMQDGKLPPQIWMAGAKWYPNHLTDPNAVRYIEVTCAMNASITMTTQSKSGKPNYIQYFLRFPEQKLKDEGNSTHLHFHCPPESELFAEGAVVTIRPALKLSPTDNK